MIDMSNESERIRELEKLLKNAESWRKTWMDQARRLDTRVVSLEVRLHELMRDGDQIMEMDHVNDRRKAWSASKEKP